MVITGARLASLLRIAPVAAIITSAASADGQSHQSVDARIPQTVIVVGAAPTDIPTADRGADCNNNGVYDALDIVGATSTDCNSNGVPDECDGAGPQVTAKLKAANGMWLAEFGRSVAIDGTTAIIGAEYDDHNGINSGSAYVFRQMNGVWQEIAWLTAEDGAAEDLFGGAVAISGSTAVIGSYLDDDSGTSSGSAYVFREVGGIWQEIAKLTAADAEADHGFGVSVGISLDTIVVGAFHDDDRGTNSGAAYVFQEIGGVWQQIAKLKAADGTSGDIFGIRVAVDGGTMLIGAYNDGAVVAGAGSAYVFRKVNGSWRETAKLGANDATLHAHFGGSVSVSGLTAVIGAPQSSDSGTAYVFRNIMDPYNPGWRQIAKLTATDATANAFGYSAAISGAMVVVGAYATDDGGDANGAAYLFREVGGNWRQVGKASGESSGDFFGQEVAIDGDIAVIGAQGDDDMGMAAGAAYVLDLAVPLGDCNGNSIFDACDVLSHLSPDCNLNNAPDECEAAGNDCNINNVPDDCESDWDSDGLIDSCDADIDDDGVGNAADVCDETPLGTSVSSWGAPKGDIDDDCLPTLADHPFFEICLWMSGPGVEPFFNDCREAFDFDGDIDVDLADFYALCLCLTTPGGVLPESCPTFAIP